MKLGIALRGGTTICVKVNKVGCSMWSKEFVPHDGLVTIDAAGVRVRRLNSEEGCPLLWVDRGWRGISLGVEGVAWGRGKRHEDL